MQKDPPVRRTNDDAYATPQTLAGGMPDHGGR